jgi:hypothetical protein
MLLGIAIAAFIAVPALAASAAGSSHYEVGIVSPADQQTFFSDNGDFPVRTTVVPDLAPGDNVEFLIDGMPVAPPSQVLEFPIYGITHGEHVLQARVIDSSGNVAAISSANVVYVWQASLLLADPGAPPL